MAQVRYTRNLFLRGICIVYLFAFLSLYLQIPGLYGDNGILPARTQLDITSKADLLQKFRQKPTLIWFAPYLGLNVEYSLDALALVGTILAFCGFVSQKFCISPVFLVLWSLYYSIHQVGQIFMSQQWENLLLETGFLCIAIAPLWFRNKGKGSTPSDGVTFWAARWLLFRLQFSTGILKLASGSLQWWNLTALKTYFLTCQIPTSLAWYAYHLSDKVLRLVTVGALVTDIALPFLFFFPNQKVRTVAFYIELFFQGNIIATGNWGFYNLLIICLCVSLLNDDFFYNRRKNKQDQSYVMERLSLLLCALTYLTLFFGVYKLFKIKLNPDNTVYAEIGFTQEEFQSAFGRVVQISIYIALGSLSFMVADAVTHSILTTKGLRNKVLTTLTTVFYTGVVVFIFSMSVIQHTHLHPSQNGTVPHMIRHVHNKIDHLHLANSYGSLKQLTTTNVRPEIILEGSNNLDGPWVEYEFMYKPGNVNSSLPFVAPHQPRLDHQLWLATFGTYHQNPWLMSLAYRLLNGQRETLNLVNNAKSQPLFEKPPKYIRANLYYYHYTERTNPSVDAWWSREKVGEYFPVFSRDHPPLIEYLTKMKIIQKSSPVQPNPTLKMIFDAIRSVVRDIESSMLLWCVLTAGVAIVMTGLSSSHSKNQ